MHIDRIEALEDSHRPMFQITEHERVTHAVHGDLPSPIVLVLNTENKDKPRFVPHYFIDRGDHESVLQEVEPIHPDVAALVLNFLYLR